MTKSEKNKAYLYLIITFFLWGSIYVVSKFLLDSLPFTAICCLRYTVALVILYIVARKKIHATKIAREDRKYFILIGALGYFSTVFLTMLGIDLTGSATGALINSLTPVSVTIIAALYLKERITKTTFFCLGLAVAGALVVAGGVQGSSQAIGVIVLVLGVVAWGFASTYLRKLSQKYDPLVVTTLGIAVSVFLHIPAVAIHASIIGGFKVDLVSILCVLYLAVFCTACAQFTWSKSLSLLPASTCSLFYPLQPLWTVLLGVLILRETVGWHFFVGFALIAVDVVIVCMQNARVSKQQELAKAAE